MTKEKKILLKKLLRQYKQSLNESLKEGDIVQISIKNLNYFFNKYGIEKIKKIISINGNKWKIDEIYNPRQGFFGADKVLLDDLPGGDWIIIINLNNNKIKQSVPDQAVKKIKI